MLASPRFRPKDIPRGHRGQWVIADILIKIADTQRIDHPRSSAREQPKKQILREEPATGVLLVAQRFDGIQAGGLDGRNHSSYEADQAEHR